jgi:hypothetical protein
VRRVDAAEDAVVMLMKLVAVDGIGQKIGKVVPKIERTLDQVDIRLRRPTLVSLRPAARQREAIGIAAVAGSKAP